MMTPTVIILTGAGLGIALLLLLHNRKLNGIHEQLRHIEDVWPARIGETMESKQRQVSNELQQAMRDSSDRISRSVSDSMKGSTDTLNKQFDQLTARVDGKLDHISSRVNERLDKGFEKTQKVFSDVLTRLSTIDEAQKRIDSLSQNVVSLQDVLTDKRARGAFGEVQLNQLVRQALPSNTYKMQATLFPMKQRIAP